MKKIALAALLSAFVAVPAFAAGFDSSKLYVGAQLSSNSYGSCSGCSSTMGFGGLVGYTVDKNWAAEASYHLLGKSTFTGGDQTTSAMAAHAVYTYPVNNQIAVLGKLGLSSVTSKVNVNVPPVCSFGICFGGFSSSTSSSSSGLSYGVAGQYSVDKHVEVRAGFDVYTVSGGSINSLYAGGVYKF